MIRFLRNLGVFAGISFVLQYIWEAWQSPIFYGAPSGKHITSPAHHGPGPEILIFATIGDVLMGVGLYLLMSLVNRDWHWIAKKYDAKDWAIMVLYALFFSFYFESRGLSTHRWGYSSLMPLFPGTNIGLVPVAQLLILLPLSFAITRLINRMFGKRHRQSPNRNHTRLM